MVCNIFKMLDENEIKILSKKEYKMVKWYDTDSLYFRFAHSDNKTSFRNIVDDELNETLVEVENPYYVEPSRKFLAWRKKCFTESMFSDGFVPGEQYRFSQDPFKEMAQDYWSRKEILDYMKIIPFTPWVMINISPDWNDCEKRTNNCKIQILKNIINSYMSEQWYEQWEYVIENGSQGNMIHAHIVAKMNTARLKSVESHLRRGNHTQQLKKYAKKVKGMEGMIKGVSVQKIFVRTEEILKDKLDYLHEERKPDGHKNLSVIVDGFVKGEL